LQSGNRYTAIMPVTAEHCWDAIYRIGADDLESDNIPMDIVTRLIAFKMVILGSDGIPHFTDYGEKCFAVLFSGEGSVLELNNLAAMEEFRE
jgi:hypothetical protein